MKKQRGHDVREPYTSGQARSFWAELERRLGHRSQGCIQRYTNPPEDVAAEYIEAF